MAPSVWVRQHTSSGSFSIRVVSLDIDSTEVIRIKSLGVCAQPSQGNLPISSADVNVQGVIWYTPITLLAHRSFAF